MTRCHCKVSSTSHDAQTVDRKWCESSETVQNEKEYETKMASVVICW